MTTTPNKHSMLARWLLIGEALGLLLIITLAYLAVSRFYSELLLLPAFVSSTVIVFSLSTLVIMYKLGSVILSFSITARYMKPNERDSIRRCRLLYRLLYLRKDRRSSDGWIVVTSGSGDRRKKLFLFRP